MHQEKDYTITPNAIQEYAIYLGERERAESTIKKYIHDLNSLLRYAKEATLSKKVLLEWKRHLEETYMPTTVNSMLAAANHFLQFKDWHELKVRPLKMQRTLFCDESRELGKEEYVRLVRTAERQKNERLSLIIQTICATGIRVSELPFITTEAIRDKRAEVVNKGKRRIIFLPEKL